MEPQKGGKQIGEGTYGCVFVPPLACKSGLKASKTMVGKLTSKEDATREITIANRLRQLPLYSNYFLLPEPESCEPLEKSKQKNTNLLSGKCSPVEEGRIKFKDTLQTFTPFGGKSSVYSVLIDTNFHPSRFDFFFFMKHILEAGASLAVAGVCHFDLHPNNILMDDKNVPHILDFGMSFIGKEVTPKTLDDRWKQLDFGIGSPLSPVILNLEPPEVTIQNAVLNNFLNFDESIKLTVMGKPIFKDLNQLYGKSLEANIKDIHAFLETSSTALKGDWPGFWRLYWPRYDSWSIGCILVYILKILLTWPAFSQGKWLQQKAIVLATLKGMLEVNVRKRLDCVEALALYDPGNLWISRFGQKWLEARRTDQ